MGWGLDDPFTSNENHESRGKATSVSLGSGMKKEHKPKLLSPDVGMSRETREIKLFGWNIPGLCWDIPAMMAPMGNIWCRVLEKGGLLERGSSQKSPISRDSRECRESRESADSGKQRRI